MDSFWIRTEREGQDGGAKDEALVSSLGNWAGGLGGNGRRVSSGDGGKGEGDMAGVSCHCRRLGVGGALPCSLGSYPTTRSSVQPNQRQLRLSVFPWPPIKKVPQIAMLS